MSDKEKQTYYFFPVHTVHL